MSDPMATGQSAWRGAIALVAVFVAGITAGVAADRYYLAQAVRPAAADIQTERRGREPGRDGAADRGEGWRIDPSQRRAVELGIPMPFVRLGLTAQQESTLSAIARRRRPAAESLMAKLRPAVSNIETEMMQEMLCALTPVQQAHWIAYMDSARFDPAIAAERYRPVRTGTCGALRR
jgi:hypothetical protein